MEIQKSKLDGAYVITPYVYHDNRGYFYETYHKNKFKKLGLDIEFVQDNLSHSTKGVLRGMHFQWNEHQGKLVRTVKGEIFDVIIDIRKNSSTFGKWEGFNLSDENHKMLWVPPGFAHGFLTLSETAIVEYKCSAIYNGENEGSIKFDDSEIGIEWPLKDVIISEKDKNGMTLKEWCISPDFEIYNKNLPK